MLIFKGGIIQCFGKSSLGSINLLAMCLGRSVSIEEPQLFNHFCFIVLLMRIAIMKAKVFG